MSYTVTSMRIEEDREALLRLWRESIAAPRTGSSATRQFEWSYAGNPYGPTRTWLLVENESNAAVGCSSFIPRNAYFRGRIVKLGVAADLAVDMKHRSLGPALAMQQAVIAGSREAGCDLLIGCPNRKSVALFNRAGYQKIGDIQYWVKPIRSEYKLIQFLRNRWLAKGAGFTVDLALAIPGLWNHISRSFGFTDEIVNEADERFDKLWNAGRSRYGLIGEKTAAYLNWRYTAFEGTPYRYYCLLRRNDRQMVGYVVFTATDKDVFIPEILCEDPDGPVLQHLLRGFASRMRKEGQEKIWLKFVGARSFGRRLKRCGFFDRGVSGRLVAWVNESLSAEYREDFLSQDNWFILRGEMDL